jgi:manganese-dependent inorganic pyrophosphatase
MKEVIVIGHKNPDTDSIVSALVFTEFLRRKKKYILSSSNFKIKAGRAGSLNKETQFVFQYFKQKPPALIKSLKNKNVFLIDHGEYEQSAEGIEQANLLGVLDHHKLGGIKTIMPIFYRTEPMGSTASVVAEMFLENDLTLNKKTAGLLLAALLSDTLKLTSPTTTQKDREIAKTLTKISKENISKLSQKMFEAKSDISGVSLSELVNKDYKEYKTGKVNFGFGVWETTVPETVEKKQDKILLVLERLKKKRKLDLMFFSLIDILKKNSKAFVLSEKEKVVLEKVFKKKVKGNSLFLSGVVSRKKQMIPPLINFLEKK